MGLTHWMLCVGIVDAFRSESLVGFAGIRSLIEYWREQYRTNALIDRPSKRERQLEAENEKLKAKIGDLVMQMDYIKKWQDWVQRTRNVDSSVITAKNLDQFRKPAK